MKKLICLFLLVSCVAVVSATTNLDFRLDVSKKTYYPNEKIPLNITVINRDEFSANEATLTVKIADRFYNFDLGNIAPGDIFNKEITLPEFPPGTQNIEGEVNYTDFMGERSIEVSYGSFEVLFPPIERYPRNIFVSDYSLPDKVIAGKSYDVSATIKNDGDVDANLLIEFGYLDEFFSENAALNAGQSKTVTKNVKFNNPGVSLIEARVYAIINGEKYLLNYRGKGTYAQEERVAKLSFDKLELVEESDNQINQDDKVNLKVFIKNNGDVATSIMGYLSSNISGLTILNSNVSYGLLGRDDSSSSSDLFKIETKNSLIGNYTLNLKLVYTDSENREKLLNVPIIINAGGDACTKDADCLDAQTCQATKCVEVSCKCGEIKNHQCNKYACCSDADCGKGFNKCNLTTHNCLKCSDINCCSEGTIWCSLKESCVKPTECFGVFDSPCNKGWPAHEGSKISINEQNYACDLFEVKDNSLIHIAEEAISCCSEGCTSGCHSYCNKAIKDSGIKSNINENTLKKCSALYITYGLGPGRQWMQNYFGSEIACSGYTEYCSPSDKFQCSCGNQKFSANAMNLPCVNLNNRYPKAWTSDSDMLKNSCKFSDLPAHVNINVISTGTCVDYSVSLTTLLRMIGFKKDEVYSSSGPGHMYNLIKLPGDQKWTFLDTVGNNPSPIRFGNTPGSWFPYCEVDDTCKNDAGETPCPSASQIYGC